MQNTSSQAAPTSGQVIAGKFLVERLLGEGGMGSVFQCVHSWTGRRVAVKLLRRDLAARQDIVERFLLEARSATRVAHPAIVEVLDMGQDPADPAQYFIAQEFLEGETLRDRLDRQGRLTIREALAILAPVLGAIEAAHRCGIVHRDIKPENIFLCRTAQGDAPKVIDFGISKWLDGGDPLAQQQRTQIGEAIGTPSYMSPEQVRGDIALDTRTDLWSLGVVLYELLAGQPPFEAATFNLVMLRVMSEDPARIETVVEGLPASLGDLVHAPLQRDREQRVASAAQWFDAMTAWAAANDAELAEMLTALGSQFVPGREVRPVSGRPRPLSMPPANGATSTPAPATAARTPMPSPGATLATTPRPASSSTPAPAYPSPTSTPRLTPAQAHAQTQLGWVTPTPSATPRAGKSTVAALSLVGVLALVAAGGFALRSRGNDGVHSAAASTNPASVGSPVTSIATPPLVAPLAPVAPATSAPAAPSNAVDPTHAANAPATPRNTANAPARTRTPRAATSAPAPHHGLRPATDYPGE